MAPGTATTPSQCEDRTIILPIGQEELWKNRAAPSTISGVDTPQLREWAVKHIAMWYRKKHRTFATKTPSGVYGTKTKMLTRRVMNWTGWCEVRTNILIEDNIFMERWSQRIYEAGRGWFCTIIGTGDERHGPRTRAAEHLNKKRYADNWLENLLVATSAVPKRKKPPLKTV